MASNLQDQAIKLYERAMAAGDPRVRDWPMMNPWHCLALIAAYLVTVRVLMMHTKRSGGYNVKTLTVLHNIHLFSLSLYMVVEIVRQARMNNYSLFSNPIDHSEKGYGMARILWIYYLSKIPEFIDTIIMALKGPGTDNFRQISFLHVYHHASIFFVWWIIVYYAPGGESYFSAALNSFIHVVMYGYYLWSAISPKRDENVKPRWTQPAFYKKYITSMQLLQFTIMMVQAIYDIVFPTPGYPFFCAPILFFYMITMLYLFRQFFVQSYKRDKAERAEKAKKST